MTYREVLSQYSCASDLFAAVKDAATERRGLEAKLKTLEERRGLSGAPWGESVQSASDDANGTMRSVAYLDACSIVERRMEEDAALVDAACAVLYGDGAGGVASLLSPTHADVLFHRYIGGDTWSAVANKACLARCTAYSMRDAAFDLIDALGTDAVVEGVGMAE